MSEDLISIIIPVYNVEKYIKKCIESVLNQSYKNLEILVVDDGSTDYSAKICQEYAEKDSRIKFFQQKNGGVSYTRNKALDIMSGEWVLFLDSDDWLEKDSIRKVYFFATKNNSDIVMFPANIVENNNTTKIAFRYYNSSLLLDKKEMVCKLLCDEIGGQVWLKFYRKLCWENVRFPVGRVYEDLAISYIPYTKVVNNIGYYDEPLYNYRMNPQSICHSNRYPEKAYHIFLAFYEHLLYSEENMPELKNKLFEKTVIYALNVINCYLRSKDKTNQLSYFEIAKDYLKKNKDRIHLMMNSRFKIMAEIFLSNEKIYFPLLKIQNFIGRILKGTKNGE